MLKRKYSILNPQNLTTIFLVILLIILPQILIDDSHNFPIPTEIIERKKDRNLFKQNRKEWMENMHRSCIDLHQTLTGGKWMQVHARINSSQIH